jgi:thiamine biosynthesis protein ThiI
MWNLEAEERGISLPVLRPLIGMDKDEIVALARRVGTYDISARVPEYCAVAQESTTRVRPEEVDEAERAMGLDYRGLIEGAEVYVVGRAEVVRVEGQRAAEKEAERRSTSPDIVSS